MAHQASTTNSSNNTTETPMKKTAVGSASQNCPDVEPLRKQVAQLNGELTRVKRRVAELEKDRLVTTLQEQLEKEEQRGEALQQHLFDISEKEGPLATRMDQINQQLSPEVIERTMAGVGSVHPEQAREEVRKRLTNEKARIQSQLDLLKQDQRRTQASLATNDLAIQRLKQKLSEAQRPQ
jgi:chromosome segregation ATPase